MPSGSVNWNELRGMSEDDITSRLARNDASKISTQDIYDNLLRPREEAQVANEIARATRQFQGAQRAAGSRNADLSARLGFAGTSLAPRFEGALSQGQSRSLGDLLTQTAASAEERLNRQGRFSLLDRIQEARVKKAETLNTVGGTIGQIANAIGTAVLGVTLPAASKPLAGVAGAIGTGAFAAGFGAEKASTGGNIGKLSNLTKTYRPTETDYSSLGGGGFSLAQPSSLGGVSRRPWWTDEEERRS